jgi:hypothetical protein
MCVYMTTVDYGDMWDSVMSTSPSGSRRVRSNIRANAQLPRPASYPASVS